MQCAERVQHQLRIVFGLHQHAHAVFQVDDVQAGFSDDDGVAGAEPAGHNVTKVQALLDQQSRIRALDLRGVELLQHVGGVVVGEFFHLIVMPRRDRALGALFQCFAELMLAKGVRGGALLGGI